MSCMYILVFQRKPCLRLMKRFNSFKRVKHFNVHNSNQKEEKEKKRKKKYSAYNFLGHVQDYKTF